MNERIRGLVDLRDRTLQKNRIAFGNRVDAIMRGADTSNKSTLDILTKWYERFDDLEKELDKDIANLVDGIEIVERLTDVKGIGKMYAAKLISLIDISRSGTVSALWRYAGYGVIDGKREKNKKGERAHYNKRLKCTLYVIATSFVKCNSPYRKIYDDAKEYYESKYPEWTKLHREYAARGKMIKIFLSHLWLVWRQIEGLPTRNVYVEEYQGHTHIIPPQEFGWKDWM